MFFMLNKPKGETSFTTIKNFSKSMNIEKIGHTGTLDPLATGALLVATDDDTKLIEYIDKGSKTYVATAKLGYTSDTLDIEGEVTKFNDVNINIKQFKDAAIKFIGESLQTPPAFSAKKIKGRRSYELARKGEIIEHKKQRINIQRMDNFKQIDNDLFQFEVEVSRGTYIRSLIDDIGKELNTRAIMTALDRTKIGNLEVKDNYYELSGMDVIDLKTIIPDNIMDLVHGKKVRVDNRNGIYAIEWENKIVGISEVSDGILKVKKILGNKIK